MSNYRGAINSVPYRYRSPFVDANVENPQPILNGIYWRVTNTSLAGGSGSVNKQWICREMEFRNNIGEIISTGGTPFDSPTAYDVPSNAFDGNINTFTTVANSAVPDVAYNGLGYQFPESVKPYDLRIANLENGFNIPPTDYKLERSNDGIVWTLHQNFTIGTADSIYYTVILV